MRKLILIHYVNSEVAKERKYAAWEPPVGNEPRQGKKIVVQKKDPLGNVIEELD